MLTKGIILSRVLNSNKYNVRIPYLETPGSETTSFEAVVSTTPGVSESLLPDDVVIVGFEDHQPNKPIILGKLYLAEEEARGGAAFDSISVQGKADLPKSTMINGVNVYDMCMKLINLTGNLDTMLDDYVTKDWVTSQRYLTTHQSLESVQPLLSEDNKLSVDYISGLKSVATSGSYEDLTDKPTLLTIEDVKDDSGFKQLLANKDNYITQHQDLSGYTLTRDLDETLSDIGFTKITDNDIVNKIDDKIRLDDGIIYINDGHIKPIIKQDLSDYALMSAVPSDIGDLTDKSSKLLTLETVKADTDIATLVSNKNKYLTSHQSLAAYTKTVDLDSTLTTKGFSKFSGNYGDLSNKPTKLSEFTNDSEFATITEVKADTDIATLVSNKNKYLTEHQSLAAYTKTVDLDTTLTNKGFSKFSGKYSDLTNKPTKLSEFTNDSEFATLTEVKSDSDIATLVNNKNKYLTEHQSLSGYATESWVNNKGYSTFSGDYNDLTGKPTLLTLNAVKADAGIKQLLDNKDIYLTAHQSLAGYATETWVGNQGYSTLTLSQVKADSGIKQLLDNKDSYLTQHQSLSAYTKTSDLESVMTTKGFTKLTTNDIDTRIANKVKLSNGTITINGSSITPITQHQDLSNYALASSVPTGEINALEVALAEALDTIAQLSNTDVVSNVNTRLNSMSGNKFKIEKNTATNKYEFTRVEMVI